MKRLAALALLATTLTACTYSGTRDGDRKNAKTVPHVLRFTGLSDVPTLNPLFSPDPSLSWLSQMTQAYLLRYDHANRPVPELALEVPTLRNGGVSRDGRTITYHLRRGVKWSDGAQFTADDVLFSTRIVLDPKTNTASKEGWDRIVAIAEPNPFTVVYHLRSPYSPFAATFFATGGANPAIMPKHLLAHSPDINKDDYNALPVGIGPFKYVAWKRGDRVELEANPLYWRGAPKLRRVVYSIIPNRDSQFNALQTGDVDLWPLAAAAYYPRLVQLSAVAILKQPSYIYYHVDFNLSRPVTSDRAVRVALRLATDRVALRKLVSRGLGVLQEGIASPASPYYDPRLHFVAYDPASAKATLEAAGWKRGASGVRAKNGVPLSVLLVSSSGAVESGTRIELLRSWWEAIGVDVQTKMLTPTVFYDALLKGSFDVAVLGWLSEPQGNYANLFGCAEVPPSGQNVVHWCNKAADAAIEDFRSTNDPARRLRDDDIIQGAVVTDVPSFVEQIRYDLFAYNTDLKGFHPNQVTAFDDMMNVDI